MKIKTTKPYFYFPHKDDVDITYKALLLNIVTTNLKKIIKVNLSDEKVLRRYSIPLQFLTNHIDLAKRVSRLDQVLQQLDVIFDLINKAIVIDEKSVTLAYDKVINKFIRYEEEVHYNRERYYETMLNPEARPIQKFKSMFDYYNELYKDNYSISSTLSAYCHGIIVNDNNRSIDDYIEMETKAKMEILSSDLTLSNYSISLLTKGCDRHIRNSISHENRHTFLEENTKVKLTDVNAKGIITYDKVFTLNEFENILRDLMITNSAFEMSWTIFNINHIDLISKYLPKKKFTSDEVEKLAFIAAKDSFFDYQSMKLRATDDVVFLLKVQPRSKIKNVTIKIGSLSKDVDIPKIPPASTQIARFLQYVYYYSGKMFKQMSVVLTSLEDEVVGVIETETSNFEQCKNSKDFLNMAIKNTIPSDYMLEN